MIRCSTALAPRCFIRTPLQVIRRSPPKSETGAGAGDNVSGNPRKSCLDPCEMSQCRSAMHLQLPRRHVSGSDPLGSRAWAWFHQFELDRQLADGADPAGSLALQARGHQLVGAHFRRQLVAQLDCALAKAERPPHWHSVSLPVQAAEIGAAGEALAELRQTLQDPELASVRGIALAACLITDRNGPLYHCSARRATGRRGFQRAVNPRISWEVTSGTSSCGQ